MNRIALSLVSIAFLTGGALRAETIKLTCLKKPVEVTYDQYEIPHVFAESWGDAYRVLGALHARERLMQMEFNRRLASGQLAEILGPGVLDSDKLNRQLGLARTCAELYASPAVPDAMKKDFAAYAEGVSAQISALKEAGFPPAAEALGLEFAPWQPVDSLVFIKYMAWDQGGTFDDLWFGKVVEKLGPIATDELWPLDRPYEVPTVRHQFDRGSWSSRSMPKKDSLATASQALAQGRGDLFERIRHNLESARVLPRSNAFGSNNWAIDGTKTKSGKPMLCNDPHLGFRLPSFWYACHLSVNGVNVAGATFPGCPIVIIGHNDKLGWGITNMQSDAVDFFVESTSEEHPGMYQHRGEWKPIAKRTETIAVRGADPVSYEIESTVHGPIVNKDGMVVSMQWAGLDPTTDPIALWKINRAQNIGEFLDALDLLEVPALNIIYADVEGNIAICPSGRLPIRHRGQGRIPADGASGAQDWDGWIPRDELPLSVNPPEHFVASANGRPHPVGYPHYLGWMWDDSYRIRRIDAMLAGAKEMTIESMKPIQNDAKDHAAERFLPTLLKASEGEGGDAFERSLRKSLGEWDFVADQDSTATLAWLRWFDHFRRAVWDDEWKPRGIEKESGSWGFNGNNRREPMLEILEYIVLENPTSIWFDDQRTPARETLREIAQSSWKSTVEELRVKPGTDLSAYAWKNFNILKINSLFGDPQGGRTGGPVVGDSFTVNPGEDGGTVGGGACLRLLVDFADVGGSVLVYPGGQSGNPASEHYADLMPLWERGEYVPMSMAPSLDGLPASAKVAKVTFAP